LERSGGLAAVAIRVSIKDIQIPPMPIVDPKSVLDTSKMSPAQREALELTEAARESAKAERGFAGNLFMGHFDVT